ncbi:restriction endonuclease subunit S [Patiriisocius marinus]|uniref:restriction endonuclease subunit S n=1 Tax=Patiriisocius marinus TaxID=1397112 RepID=UPI00232AB836|nr:restriction endonuclease subunit S [Patiriisocius marinus]
MNKDIRNAQLNELYKFQYGKGNTIEDIGGDYPIYGSNGPVGFTNIFNSESAPIIGHIGAYAGIVNWATGKHYVTYNGVICKIKKGVNPKFGYYTLLVSNLRNRLRGSTQPFVSYDLLNDVKVYLPQRKIQDCIAKVLSDLDAKIEINNKINLELESISKTIYEYWFLQFDFPDANGNPYKSSGGKMVYNEVLKREIPEGWVNKTIADWIEKDKSGDWGKESKEGNYTEKVSCVRGADINGLNGNGEVKAPERFILEKNSHKLLENGDLIIEISGGSPTQSTGRMAFITQETLERFENPLICSNFCKAVTLKDETYLYNFVYQWQRLYDAGVLFGWEGKTSGIKNLLFESFVTNYKTVFPKKDIVEKFYQKIKPIHAKKQKNLRENQKLADLRDWLLPMLMNGQVTVKEAQEHINQAAEQQGNYS